MIKLKNQPTFNPELQKEEIIKETKKILKEIGELQNQMFAQKKYSLLVIIQGLDASGKDGLTKGLLRYTNPVGIKTKSFQKPTEKEYMHDFLWRVHQHTPPKGVFQVFIRSHYEDILVPSVEGYLDEVVIDDRYNMINSWEQLLEQNDTKILKFFLNVSKEVQEDRLIERLENPKKHWKHDDSDWEARAKFDDYHRVYDEIFEKCNAISWHIIPADTNWQKLYYVAKEVLKTLQEMPLEWPGINSEKYSLESIKRERNDPD